MSKTGIFLTGGGGIGAFHIGFFKALEEAGIGYDLVCGESVGALIGGAATYLKSDEMLYRWNQLTLESILKIDSTKFKDIEGTRRNLKLIKECFLSCCRRDPHLMIDVNDIRKQLYDLLDGDKIRESKVDFGVATTKLPSMKLKTFFKEDMVDNPLEYILASIYLPILSRQRIIDNKHYIDLSRWRRYPLEMLKEKKCDKVFVVNIERENLRYLEKPILKNFNNGEEVTFINYERKPSILDFSREQSDRNFENGYETTIKTLSKSLRL